MTVSLDNLGALLIGGVVLIILLIMQLRWQGANQDRAALYTSKKHTLSLADMLVRDLSNLGVEMPSDERITGYSVNEASVTDTLRFARVNTAGDTLRIEYRLVEAGSINYLDSTIVVYQFERYENGNLAGSSTPTLRSFSLELLDGDGDPVAGALQATRQLRIGLINVVPFGASADHYMPSTYWGTTLRPRSLNPHIP